MNYLPPTRSLFGNCEVAEEGKEAKRKTSRECKRKSRKEVSEKGRGNMNVERNERAVTQGRNCKRSKAGRGQNKLRE